MARLSVTFADGSEKTIDNVTGAGLDKDKLVITSDDGETSLSEVIRFKFDHQFKPLSFLYDDEITDD